MKNTIYNSASSVLIYIPDNKSYRNMLAVLIKRVLAPGMETTYEDFSRKIVQAAIPAQGFISSKAFKDINDPCVRFALIQMETLADWQAWQQSAERTEALGPIQPLMLEPESISILTTA